MMRILFITDYLPYPLIGGERIRVYNLLRRVASKHEVSIAGFLDPPDDLEAVAHLEKFCVKVETARLQRRSSLTHLPGLMRFALAGKPMELKFLHSEELVSKIKLLTSTMDFDIVQIEPSRMGFYLENLPRNNCHKSLLMFQNFTYQQYFRVFQIERRWDRKVRSLLNSLTMRQWEPHFAERFDRCAAVSEIDRRLLLKANPRLRVEVIPNGVDIQKYQPLPDENIGFTLLFIGSMEYPPCVDACLYFCHEILPIIKRMIGPVDLWLVGRNPRPEVRQLGGGGVHVTGKVEDVLPFYKQSAVCIVPLRAGGGTRLKILEAMALGRPVVSTTIGCEGLDVLDGEHLLIADTPQQFARQSVRLLTDRQLYRRISANGRRLVEARYDWDQIAGRLMEVYTEVQMDESKEGAERGFTSSGR
jgi:sugar transferase (PEP-CTERM/EpsH1 system associated)